MDSSTKKMETKLPEGSEAEKIQKENNELRKILNNLHKLEKTNPEHPSVKERKTISKETIQKSQELKDEILLNQLTDIYEKIKNNPNNTLENKAKELELQYYNSTGFPVPFNRELQMITPIE